MGGEGSMQSMATILRNNKKLLRRRKPFRQGTGFERLRDEYRKYSSGTVESKPLTKKELLEIRKKIKNQNRKENLRLGILAFFALIVIIGSTFFLFQNLRDYQKEQDIKTLKAKTEKYLFYIEDGDRWLNKGHFNNAIFQYLLAKEIFPNEYDINYRLVLVYGNKCKHEQLDCPNGLRILKNLKVQFPEKNDLEKLNKYFD